ncbi:hypothetical protein [Alteribacter populi]|uniref:hypothetical protein n=1 Tax=Alteribacter populi TaxID=2011011 RepID=UPI000BBA7DE0|nr:hypothetical protein [Alteribacter populi]
MILDRIVFSCLFLAALGVLLFSIEGIGSYPYFITTVIIFSTSLVAFVLFLTSITKEWLIRLVVINISLIILLPILESGSPSKWIWISLLFTTLLVGVCISYKLMNQK